MGQLAIALAYVLSLLAVVTAAKGAKGLWLASGLLALVSLVVASNGGLPADSVAPHAAIALLTVVSSVVVLAVTLAQKRKQRRA